MKSRGEIQCKDRRAPKWAEALCTPVCLNSPRRPYTLGAKEVSGMTQKRSIQGDVCNRGVGPAANWKIKKKKKASCRKSIQLMALQLAALKPARDTAASTSAEAHSLNCEYCSSLKVPKITRGCEKVSALTLPICLGGFSGALLSIPIKIPSRQPRVLSCV